MTIITYALIGGVAGGGSLLVVCITLISSVAIISVCTKRGIKSTCLCMSTHSFC